MYDVLLSIELHRYAVKVACVFAVVSAINGICAEVGVLEKAGIASRREQRHVRNVAQ